MPIALRSRVRMRRSARPPPSAAAGVCRPACAALRALLGGCS